MKQHPFDAVMAKLETLKRTRPGARFSVNVAPSMDGSSVRAEMYCNGKIVICCSALSGERALANLRDFNVPNTPTCQPTSAHGPACSCGEPAVFNGLCTACATVEHRD